MNIKSRTKWDSRFIALAKEVATWSKDPKTKVGAVLISTDKRQISYGYNGLPSGLEDSSDRLSDVELKLNMTVHAELNAILNSRQNLTGWTLYVTKSVCHNCAKAVIQAGITNVVMPAPVKRSKWLDSQQCALDMFAEAKISLSLYVEDL